MSTKNRFIAKNGIDANSLTLVNMLDPVNPQDGATQNYVVTYSQPLDVDLTAFSALATTGFISRAGAGSLVSRTITGTSNQIDVTAGDGLSGNPTVSITNNPVLPGTAKYTWPAGTTAQRPPAPVNGDSRYNTDLSAYEQYSAGVWNSVPKMPTVLGAVQARRTTTLVTTTTAVDITFDTVDLVSNSAICNRDATNTNRLVAYVAGVYQVEVTLAAVGSATASALTLKFLLNGVTAVNPAIIDKPGSTSAQADVNLTALVNMAANDYLTVQVLHTSNSLTIQTNATVILRKLDGVAGANGAQGAMGGSNSLYYAVTSMDSPNNANWAVNALGPLQADPTNAAITVRAFDDTLEEGCGATVFIPSTAANITFKFNYRPSTAPATTKGVVLHLYTRGIPVNAAVGTWSTATTLTTLNIPVNAFFQTASQTLTLASLGLTAGQNTQLEITRHGANVLDTLVGDFYLLDMTVSFS